MTRPLAKLTLTPDSPAVPIVEFATNRFGFRLIVLAPWGDEFLVLSCDHYVLRDSVAKDATTVPCHRCWEAELGTVEGE